MSGLADNFLFDPLLRQPLLSAEREDSHDKLVASVTINSSELDISPFGVAVVLCLVKSKRHCPPELEGAPESWRTPPPLRRPHSDNPPCGRAIHPCPPRLFAQCESVPSFSLS